MSAIGRDPLLGGGSSRLETEVGHGQRLGERFVGTPRMSVRMSRYRQEHLVGYSVTALEQSAVNLELGIDADRRAMHGLQQLRGEGGGADQRVLGPCQPRLVGRPGRSRSHRGADPDAARPGGRKAAGARS